MKRIMKCCIFLLILMPVLIVLSQIMVPKNNTEQAGMERKRVLANGIFVEPENTIDVLVAGDSESYSSFIPLELWNKYGFTSYVCGSPAQPITLTYSFIKDALENQSPKIVILEADNFYRRKGLEGAIKETSNRALPVFQYHDRWKSLNKEDFYEKVNYTEKQQNKGYYYSDKTKEIKKKNRKKYMEESKKIKNISKMNLIYIKKIKQLCDSKNIKLMFYNAPTPANWNYEKHNGVERLAKDLKVDYIDLNVLYKDIKIDWKKDSQDKKGEHLNYVGALKVTNYLGEYLNSKYELPDHRLDNMYNSWNEDYKNFKNLVNENVK